MIKGKNKKFKPKKASQKKRKSSKKAAKPKLQLFLIMLILLSAVFLSTAVMFFIGLLPMFVAFFVDRSPKKTKAITVGAMNFAGCTPFVIELWTSDRSLEKAFSIIFDPMAIIVIYSAAGVGYLLDWAVSVVVANFLYQKGQSRQKAIKKRQEELEKRWGKEVTGAAEVDEDGFPV